MRLLMLLLAASLLPAAHPGFSQTLCAKMTRLPDVTAATQTAGYCRISISLQQRADSVIKAEVWLPSPSVWNGKLLMEGGGGLVGTLNTEGMTHAIHEGYASASTDTGHTQQRQVCTRPS